MWCGGDASFAGTGSGADPSQTTVESANDGKTAAYHIHQYLQVGGGARRSARERPGETTACRSGGKERGHAIIIVIVRV